MTVKTMKLEAGRYLIIEGICEGYSLIKYGSDWIAYDSEGFKAGVAPTKKELIKSLISY